MKPSPVLVVTFVVSLLLAPALLAQSQDSANQSAAAPPPSASAAEVPRLIKFSGTLVDAQERPMIGPVGVTFALYARQTGGAALWVETQNVKTDSNGAYTVLLGAASANGVPAELFVSGEARWLGIQVGQQQERERILLVSVPYALKAGDAETLGGLPASAFVTTGTGANTASAGGVAAATSPSSTALPKSSTAPTPKKASTPQPATPCSSVTSDGAATPNTLALFTTACNIQSSVITQSSGNVGIGTATPAVAVDVVGNNAGLRLSGTGTHQVTVTGATSGRLGQDANGFFFASDTNGKSVRFLTNNGTLNEWMRITSAGNIGIGTATPTAKLDVNGNQNIAGNLNLSGAFNLPTTTGPTSGVISLGGLPFAHNFGSSNAGNTFLGLSAGNFTLVSGVNTAVGFGALTSNSTGGSNTAVGFGALGSDTSGGDNSAVGVSTLSSNTTGSNNTAVGVDAMFSNTMGGGNTAVGFNALGHNTSGVNNSAFGLTALQSLTSGDSNVALGQSAGINLTSGSSNIVIGPVAGFSLANGSNNIYIGNNGATSESNIIRIGTGQTATSIAGIFGATSAGGVAVLVNSSGQLGTATSSRRFKEEIADMGPESDLLMKLRPVAFYYKPELDDTHTRQYGLVAEEVAQVAPQLVVFDKDGAPQTVRYHFVNAMLLNEVQKQRRQVEEQQQTIQKLTVEIRELRKTQRAMALVQARLARLESQQKRALTAPPEDKTGDRNNGSPATQGR